MAMTPTLAAYRLDSHVEYRCVVVWIGGCDYAKTISRRTLEASSIFLQGSQCGGEGERYAQIEKEALAICWGCEKFNYHPARCEFIVETAHKLLVSVLGSRSSEASVTSAEI